MKSKIKLSLLVLLSLANNSAKAQCATIDDLSGTFLTMTNTCANDVISNNTYDAYYKPDVYDELLTIKYNLQIIQKSNGSQNFQEGNTTHEAYLDALTDHINNYHANVRLPIYEGVTITSAIRGK